jgi:DNA-binding SARP family transcriptional activator/tetratricopeptide (TPR) repeat protein
LFVLRGAVNYCLLGPVTVRTRKGLISPGGPIAGSLLACLALKAGQVVPFSTLTTLLWDSADVDPSRLYAPVSRLRKLLRSGGDDVLREGQGYLLRRTETETDLELFQRLAARAREQDGEGAVRSFHEALALWTGQPLMGVTASLADRERPRLAELRLNAQEDCFEAELSIGRYPDVIANIPPLLAQNRTRERLHEQFMRALHRAGRGPEALDVYARLRSSLAGEFGTDPSPRLHRLQAAILRNDYEAGTDMPPAQVRVARGPVPPAELPPGRPDFTGRVAEIRHLDESISGTASALRVVAVTGMPGSGKTALATHWAHRMADRFPDGQLYLTMHGHDRVRAVQPLDALAKFLRSLGLPAERVPAAEDEAAALFRSMMAGRRVLVLLDDAGTVEQVRPLLPGASGCFVLVTSRDRLADLMVETGARGLALDTLPADDAVTLISRTVGLQRAEAEPIAVRELAELCGHLPLGIVIAAANLAGRPGQPIADYIRTLRTDTVGRLRVDQGRAAVRAVFDQAYASLSPSSQRFFHRLGLMPGSEFGVPAAAALAGVDEEAAQEILHGLYAANFAEIRAPGRYVVHDLLRAYAHELAVSADEDNEAAIARLHGWYLGSADSAARLLYPEKLRLTLPRRDDVPPPQAFPDREHARSWLDLELRNLLAIVHDAGTRGPAATAWLLSDVLRGYFWLAELVPEWLDAARTALRAARGHGSPSGESAALLSIGTAHSYTGDYQSSADAYAKALRGMRRSGWLDGEVAAVGNLGFTQLLSGRPVAAARHLAKAVRLARHAGRDVGLATNVLNLGYTYQRLGRLEEAEQAHEEALNIYQDVQSAAGVASATHGLGVTFTMIGELDRAFDLLGHARTVYAEVGDRYRDVDALVHLARLHRDAGRGRLAEESAGRAWRLAEETGQLRQQAHALNVLGAIHRESGRLQEAKEHHTRALRIAVRLEHGGHEAEARTGLAYVAPEPEAALRNAEAALALSQALGYRVLQAEALVAMAEVCLRNDDRRASRRHARRARDLQRAVGYEMGQARATRLL